MANPPVEAGHFLLQFKDFIINAQEVVIFCIDYLFIPLGLFGLYKGFTTGFKFKKWIFFICILGPWYYSHYAVSGNLITKLSAYSIVLSLLINCISAIFLCFNSEDTATSFDKKLEEASKECNSGYCARSKAPTFKKLLLSYSFILILATGGFAVFIIFIKHGHLEAWVKLIAVGIYLLLTGVTSKYYIKFLGEDLELRVKEHNDMLENPHYAQFLDSNPYSKEINAAETTLLMIDRPVFISYIIFSLSYLLLYINVEVGNISDISLEHFAYGGLFLHILSATSVFLIIYAKEVFDIDFKSVITKII